MLPVVTVWTRARLKCTEFIFTTGQKNDDIGYESHGPFRWRLCRWRKANFRKTG